MKWLLRKPLPRFLLFVAIVTVLAFFIGNHDAILTGSIITEVVPEQHGSFDVYFCQVDDCEAAMLAAIETADEVKCAFYDLDYEVLEQLLDDKEAEVLVFEDYYEGFGTEIKAPHGGLMHNKFCILDEKTVITGSTNPTDNGINKNDNNLVVIEGAYLAQNYLDEFEELQGKKEKKVKYEKITHFDGDNEFIIENYFCPEDDCEEEVLKELDKTKNTIQFMTFSFTSDPIGEMLIEKHAEGVEVKGVFEKRQESRYSEYGKLDDAGLDVRFDSNPATMHHKVFIIDEETVIFGSYNPSKNGNTRNDENVLIIHDKEVAEGFSAEFSRVWELP